MEANFSSFGPNQGYVEELYRQYLSDRTLVGETWASYFDTLSGSYNEKPIVQKNGNGASYLQSINSQTQDNYTSSKVAPSRSSEQLSVNTSLFEKVFNLVQSYRIRGHLRAKTNPLSQGIFLQQSPSDLDPSYFGVRSEDLNTSVPNLGIGTDSSVNFGALLDQLNEIYCGPIGFEYMHLTDPSEREWLRSRIENWKENKIKSTNVRLDALKSIVEAETLESELHKKFVGAKRFSLEGSESLMPMIESIIENGSVDSVVIGMAHRGRLNVLVNTVGKPLKKLCQEFQDCTEYASLGAGDVKYHMGYNKIRHTKSGKKVEVSLIPNPSHLEFVNPVVEGVVRAKQDYSYRDDPSKVMPILIHGDAAVIGQGIVVETFNFSRSKPYTTQGTYHLIINNQIGFTTTSDESRSSNYCSDFAKAVEAPVFHVNGEDVDACLFVAELALDFRNEFNRDVVIDLISYRKYGHNEGDDPTFTQPHMYSEIKAKKPISTLYLQRLVEEGVADKEFLTPIVDAFKERFDEARDIASATPEGEACPIHGVLVAEPETTIIDESGINIIAGVLTDFPNNFTPHPKLKTVMEKRAQSYLTGDGIDWGGAETLAFASLVLEGVRVRLTGQDACRGTFSHRHLVLDSISSSETFSPLSRLPFSDPGRKGSFEVYNSTLSEAAVLGFEFGYAAENPSALVLWEAQFGDFVNGAQVIIDQFIASSEAKWVQRSGVVLLLPHGYEGQGPEHSSARLERFLQLCAEGNMTVAYPTNGAQYFHLLRRQALSDIKRPLIIMTPKSLLRLPDASNTKKDFTERGFQKIIETNFGKGKHTVFLSGKIYYDVVAELKKVKNANIRVVRIEQIYPFPDLEIRSLIKKSERASIAWVQEEPMNQGAYTFVEPKLRALFGLSPRYIGRVEAGPTACGSPKFHAKEQKAIVASVVELATS